MKTRNKQKAFTLVELLLSLALLAMLMTAVAFAFDASVKNYKANQGIYQTVNIGRQALLRITSDVRTAQAVAHIGTGGDPDASQVSLLTSGGKDITYRFDNSEGILYYDDNTSGDSYVLCRHVTAAAFNRALVPATTTNAVRSVRVSLTLTDDTGDLSQTVAAASLVRRNL
jgi:prepilin-type N-terminal cleavage/methylation domain-containing protein